jgi:hypothetical protein
MMLPLSSMTTWGVPPAAEAEAASGVVAKAWLYTINLLSTLPTEC